MIRQSLALMSVVALALPAQTTRDSAGVRIVTYSRSAQAAAEWRLSPQPVVAVGGVDGTGPTEFTRIWGAARASSGQLFVSDEPTQQIRVFDASGKHLRTFGRRGDGPGEFGQIRGLVIYGDTLYALDDINGTGVFRLDGTLIRQVRYPTPLLPGLMAVDPWGVFADGSVIEGAARRESREIMMQVGRRYNERGIVRVARDHRSATLLVTLPSYEYFRAESDPPGGDVVALSPVLTVAVHRDRFCSGFPSTFEIQCRDADGRLRVIIRRDVEPPPVTAALRSAYLDRIRSSNRVPSGEGRVSDARLQDIAARTRFAQTLPAFDLLIRGADGETWVGEYDALARTIQRGDVVPASRTRRWHVFAADGRWIASLVLPARLTVEDVGRDYVVGVNRDDDDVPRVEVYRILR